MAISGAAWSGAGGATASNSGLAGCGASDIRDHLSIRVEPTGQRDVSKSNEAQPRKRASYFGSLSRRRFNADFATRLFTIAGSPATLSSTARAPARSASAIQTTGAGLV